MLRGLLAVVLVAPALAACGDDFRDFDASVIHDLGVPDEGLNGEGGVPVKALFTVSGCDKLEFDSEARPRCTAPRSRPLTFIPLGVGVSTVLWSFPGGQPASSTLLTPEASFASIGTYTVSLAAAAGAGTALATGSVQIVPGGPGSACKSDVDCDGSVGLTCVCGEGSDCPASLAQGLCARRCETTSCAPGEACIDLTRSGAALGDGGVGDGGATDPFRVRLCAPTCATSATCRTGFDCRELPEVAAGAPPDGTYSWVSACFSPVLGDVGAACATSEGVPDGSRCLTGQCEALGARGVCSAACDAESPCPSYAVCATVPDLGPRCLRRCTDAAACDDPLLDCVAPGPGGLGYSFAGTEPAGTMACAARRCTVPADCGPAGTCANVGGALFCVK